MPVPVLRQVLTDGLDSVPYASTFLRIALVLGIVYGFKAFFQGASNGSERNMHGKVVMVTVILRLFDHVPAKTNSSRAAHLALANK